jgi:hypothetical protein
VSSGAHKDDDVLRMLVRDAEVFHAEAHLRWLDHCGTVLRGLERSPTTGDEPPPHNSTSAADGPTATKRNRDLPTRGRTRTIPHAALDVGPRRASSTSSR